MTTKEEVLDRNGFDIDESSVDEVDIKSKLWWDDIDDETASREDCTAVIKVRLTKKLIKALKEECRVQGETVDEYMTDLLHCALS